MDVLYPCAQTLEQVELLCKQVVHLLEYCQVVNQFCAITTYCTGLNIYICKRAQARNSITNVKADQREWREGGSNRA